MEDVPFCFVLTTKPGGSAGFKVEIRREECNDQAVIDNYSETPGRANSKISQGRGVICEYRGGEFTLLASHVCMGSHYQHRLHYMNLVPH